MINLIENLKNMPQDKAIHDLSFYYVNSNDEDKDKIINYILDLEDSPTKITYLKTISVLDNNGVKSYFDYDIIKNEVSESLHSINKPKPKQSTVEKTMTLLKNSSNEELKSLYLNAISIGDSIIEQDIYNFNSFAKSINSKFRLTTNSLLYDNNDLILFYEYGIVVYDHKIKSAHVIITDVVGATVNFNIDTRLLIYHNDGSLLLSVKSDKIVLFGEPDSNDIIKKLSEMFNIFLANKTNRLKG